MSGFKKMGIMVDCSRNAVPTVETLKKFINLMKKMGYNIEVFVPEQLWILVNVEAFLHWFHQVSPEMWIAEQAKENRWEMFLAIVA